MKKRRGINNNEGVQAKLLIADNAPAIELGFIALNGEAIKRINCRANYIRNIDDELCKNKNLKFEKFKSNQKYATSS